MRKNILLITSIYPSEQNSGTPVCHYFARDWIKIGYRVIVIHIHPKFPMFFYWFAKLFKSRIEAMTGNIVDTERETSTKHFIKDGVSVYRLQASKSMPHGKFTGKALKYIKKEILEIMESEKFVPDFVCAHFPNPQIELLYFLKNKFHEVITCYISHGDDLRKDIRDIYGDKYENEYRKSIDVFGYRSKPIRVGFENKYGIAKHSFICFSGIPEEYISNVSHSFNERVKHFCFLGSLYKLKKIDITLQALAIAFPNKNFMFDIIGDGAERKRLEYLAKSLDIADQVKFHGRKSRAEAQSIMAAADSFIMISSHEAFGLVYLEAMGKGLITIGTKGQGIDGIIRNGENGFLCKSNDIGELVKIIKRIISLDAIELQNISAKAIKTAKLLTDINAAKNYINAIININK